MNEIGILSQARNMREARRRASRTPLPRVAEAADAPPADADLWPEPEPLPDLLPSVAPFDPVMLPACVRPYVEDVAERMQCPIDFPAVAMMIVLAGVIGRKVTVRPKQRDDWTVVANLWGLAVGRPGIMKTPAIGEPMKFLKRLEIAAKGTYDTELKEYKAAQIVSKAARENAQQAVKKALRDGANATELARQAIAQEQDEPIRRRYLVNDATVEKLGEIQNENPNGITLLRDEIYAFLRSLDKDGHEQSRGFYLEAWNGNGRYSYDRIGRGTIDIEAACVSMLGTIQPGRLAEYVRSAARGGSGDDGLIQRFQLAVWPDSPSSWRNVDRWPDTEAKGRVFELVCHLDQMTACEVGATQQEGDDFPYLRFTAEAQDVFDDWLRRLEIRLRRDELAPVIESHLAKYRSLIPSLALLIHLADGGRQWISRQALEKALRWSEYLESHSQRVYASASRPDLVAARALARKIEERTIEDGFSLREVYRQTWSGLATREDAQQAAELLSDLDWLQETTVETTGRPRRAFKINPRIRRKPPGGKLTEPTEAPSVSIVSSEGEGFQHAADEVGEL